MKYVVRICLRGPEDHPALMVLMKVREWVYPTIGPFEGVSMKWSSSGGRRIRE